MAKRMKRSDRMASLNAFMDEVLDVQEMIAEIDEVFDEISETLGKLVVYVAENVRKVADYILPRRNLVCSVVIPTKFLPIMNAHVRVKMRW